MNVVYNVQIVVGCWINGQWHREVRRFVLYVKLLTLTKIRYKLHFDGNYETCLRLSLYLLNEPIGTLEGFQLQLDS